MIKDTADRAAPAANFRSVLGRSSLPSLEDLVAASIANTVTVELATKSLSALIGIVLLLVVWINGRWP